MKIFVIYSPTYDCYGRPHYAPHSYWTNIKLARKMLKGIPENQYPFMVSGVVRDEKWLSKEIKKLKEEI